MPTSTTNFNLIKDSKTDYYNITTPNTNLDTIDAALGNTARFEKAGGTATAITMAGITLSNGCSKTFIVASNNNSATTTVNGKRLYKPGTTTPPKLLAGEAETIWYDSAGDCFFINAKDVATASADGFMSSADKTKLDGVTAGANNYTHPSTHPPAIITQDANNRFVSDTEKATWNGKAPAVNPSFTGYTLFQRTGGSNNYSNGNIELRTTDNTPPLIGFHRAGVTAAALYESGLRLYTTNSSDATPRKVMQDNDFIFQTAIPTSLANGVICFVYE